KQNQQHLTQLARVDLCHHWLQCTDGKLKARGGSRLELRTAMAEDVKCELVKLHKLTPATHLIIKSATACRRSVHTCPKQQIVDQRGDPLRLIIGILNRGDAFLLGQIACAVKELQASFDSGERGAQLVRCVSDETTLSNHRVLKCCQHLVEGGSQLSNLVTW